MVFVLSVEARLMNRREPIPYKPSVTRNKTRNTEYDDLLPVQVRRSHRQKIVDESSIR